MSERGRLAPDSVIHSPEPSVSDTHLLSLFTLYMNLTAVCAWSAGLVATIKEHITKPTAMAQGRVAHLIEWKGWGVSEGRAGGWSGTWGKGGSGRGGMEAMLQEDAHFYSQMTDEIKEARFAAGETEKELNLLLCTDTVYETKINVTVIFNVPNADEIKQAWFACHILPMYLAFL